MTDDRNLFETPLSRREVVWKALSVSGAVAAGPLIAACGGSKKSSSSSSGTSSKDLKGTGTVVIGAFQDGALVPFKDKIIPLFKKETGISIKFLEDEYDTFFEKAFNDGRSKAGQYDVYIMDDPWIPQYASGGILEDLGSQGLKLDGDFIPSFSELG